MNFEKIAQLDQVLNGRINGTVIDQVLKRLTETGENYLSLILKVDIKIKDLENKEEVVQTVAKFVPPAVLKSGQMFMANPMFLNEINWYDKVLPIYHEFERKHNIAGLMTDIYPKFYGGRLSLDQESQNVDKDAVVILEYLEEYSNDDRHVGFDYTSTKAVIKALARFQALPVAIKSKNPVLFKEKILPYLNNMPKPPLDDDNKPKFDPKHGIIDIIKESPRCQAYIEQCKKALEFDPFGDSDNIVYREPWATTVHTDFWVNNIMLKRDNDDIRVKIVDFQAVCYKSFAVDLIFFLLLSVQTSVLKEHLDELVKFYYDTFIGYLKDLDVDTSEFKYEDYLKEIEIETKTGQFGHAVTFSNIVFRERGTGPDTVLDDNPDAFMELVKTKTQRQRAKIVEIVEICGKKNWI